MYEANNTAGRNKGNNYMYCNMGQIAIAFTDFLFTF